MEMSSKKRVRSDSESSELNSVEVKRLRDDLFGILDDSDECTSQDLDSFMKSFEKEISKPTAVSVVDLTSDSGASRPDLGYLLEATDDELGLPPSMTSYSVVENRVETQLFRVSSDSVELSELWGFDDQIPGYDSFEFGLSEADGYSSNNNGEYVALDGLFDYSDIGFGPSDFNWRFETLPAQ